ncbi:microviridin/marinostatin family tricyclic proteinase inhibitor [Nodularia chucula]|uniref:microviridin/marinostatin family tricyclic proteinase inhibitor n=1 Tax=Nodularia chucula TaxID=3093667 RepID=UPI0039C5B29F
MSNNKPEDLNSETVPFFARFLEGQTCEEVTEEQSEMVTGGRIFATRKFPSDSDEYAVTLKFPSDNEDSGSIQPPSFGNGNSGFIRPQLPSFGNGSVSTMKYPSDNEESSPDIA